MSVSNWNHIDSLKEKVLSGDQESYREFLGSVSSYARHIIRKTIPDSLNDDVLQEVLLAIHKSLSTLDPTVSCKAWVNAIIRYKISDELRKIYKQKNEELMEDLSIESENQVDIKQYLEQITKTLNQKEKEILLKLKYEGFSVAEVAKEKQLSEANVKVISFRAIKKIKEFVLKEELNER